MPYPERSRRGYNASALNKVKGNNAPVLSKVEGNNAPVLSEVEGAAYSPFRAKSRNEGNKKSKVRKKST